MRSFYLPRWRRWYEHIGRALETGSPYRAEEFEASLVDWEERWTARRGETASTGPQAAGATLDVVRTLMPRYRAYRG